MEPKIDDRVRVSADAVMRVTFAEVDRLRAIEAAARAWLEADNAYVEAPFGEDEEEQAVAHVAKNDLREALEQTR